jgi:hypothetical protein
MAAELGLCDRCRRPVPPIESDEYSTWEVVVGDDTEGVGMRCPGCMTRKESDEIAEDAAATAAEAHDLERRELPDPGDEGPSD